MNPDPPISENKNGRTKHTHQNTRAVLLVGTIVVGAFSFAAWYFLSPNTGFVTGAVTIDGKPLPGAQIIFLLDDGTAGPLLAASDKQGRYILHGPTVHGVPVGDYRILIEKWVITKSEAKAAKPGVETFEPADANKVNLVPSEYSDVNTTPMRAAVRRGSNEIMLQIKSRH